MPPKLQPPVSTTSMLSIPKRNVPCPPNKQLTKPTSSRVSPYSANETQPAESNGTTINPPTLLESASAPYESYPINSGISPASPRPANKNPPAVCYGSTPLGAIAIPYSTAPRCSCLSSSSEPDQSLSPSLPSSLRFRVPPQTSPGCLGCPQLRTDSRERDSSGDCVHPRYELIVVTNAVNAEGFGAAHYIFQVAGTWS